MTHMVPEDAHIEYKVGLTDKFEREVVAFLNSSEGGVIYIGVDDEGNPIKGLDVDDIQLRVASRIRDGIVPATLGIIDVSVERVQDVPVVKLIVSGGPDKPYYERRYGMSERGCSVRVGSAVQPMPQAMIDGLFACRARPTIRNIRSPRQKLTFTQLKIYYEGHGLKLNDEFEETLDLRTDDGAYNWLAYLLADENGVSMKVAKYAGQDKYYLLENEEYGYCSILKALDRVLDKMLVENTTKARITPKYRIERKLVDATALREAIINAVVHNDWTMEVSPVVEIYSDRITVSSYGGLVPGQSLEGFFAGRSVPRSRELMRVFRDMELVEQLGSGMRRILDAYGRDAFEIDDNFICVTFPFSQEALGLNDDVATSGETESAVHGTDGTLNETINETINETLRLDEKDRMILAFLERAPRATYGEIATETGMARATVSRRLSALSGKGVLKRVGARKNGYWEVLFHEEADHIG